MASNETQEKWDRAATIYDFTSSYGPEKRWKPHKQKLFSSMEGNILFLAMGTGLDIACFPPGKEITCIDISSKMLEKAKPRIEAYDGNIVARKMDVHEMDFADNAFDQVYTSCTFCSVPDPVGGLIALRRVLKPGGVLKMFEHTGSRYFPFRQMLNLVNPLMSKLGPDINRDTITNVESAGFIIEKVTNIFLDTVKTIEATTPHD